MLQDCGAALVLFAGSLQVLQDTVTKKFVAPLSEVLFCWGFCYECSFCCGFVMSALFVEAFFMNALLWGGFVETLLLLGVC